MLSPDSVAELNRCFGMPGLVVVNLGHGGLPRVVVNSPECEGEMYLHGGHVTSWVPKASKEVIYCSPNAIWQDGVAIRGGVPVCFPWFGDKSDNPAAPAHGVVRAKEWQLQAVERLNAGVRVSMVTESDGESHLWWPFDFRLVCRATFSVQLTLELIAINTGTASCSFEEALHTYFAVGDAEATLVSGLDATFYTDKVDHFKQKVQSGDVRFSAETDRVYLNTAHDIELLDPVLTRTITIHKENSSTTVVWNPGERKSAGMKDLGAGEWRKFVCIETSNVGASAVQLAPGESHTVAAHINRG